VVLKVTLLRPSVLLTWTLLQFTSSQLAMTSSNTTPVFLHLSMLMALHLPFTCSSTHVQHTTNV
jgi:hypothetical protein